MSGNRYVQQNLFLAYVCWTKDIPVIGYVRQTYSWHTLCWTKPHMGISCKNL